MNKLQIVREASRREGGSILIIGYAPLLLMAVCSAIDRGQIQPALVIGMPIGFSHAPAAKRRLMAVGVPYIIQCSTIDGHSIV